MASNTSSRNSSITLVDYGYGYKKAPGPPLSQRIVDSFRRDRSQSFTFDASLGDEFDVESALKANAAAPLSRRLGARHIQMIAFGGSIGSGLFISSGRVLATAGPASLVISFSTCGVMIFFTMQALGELSVFLPVAGSFSTYATRFLDPAWSFAMGWNYALGWLVALPLELIAISITIEFWETDISSAAWVAMFLVIIVAINIYSVKGYGESEFILALIKVVAIIGFIILGVIMDIGGGPDGSCIGGRYWRDPGAFHNGFKGFCGAFATSAIGFGGSELVGLCAAETENPRKNIPKAIKQVFWRIALFNILSITLVGLLVPYTDPRLLSSGSNNKSSVKSSPFVIAIENARIQVLPSVMNVVIMLSVLSVGNGCIYASSRVIASLAEQGQAPSFLAYIDRRGRPLFAILASSLLGFLAFLATTNSQKEVFNWLVAIAGLSWIFTWATICLMHIRFRKAFRIQGYDLDDLDFRSPFGVVGSWIGFSMNIIILISLFWVAILPIGYSSLTTGELIENFFQVYLAAPFVVICYLGYKLWYKTPFIKAKDMNLQIGRKQFDFGLLAVVERSEQRRWPRWKKIYRLLC